MKGSFSATDQEKNAKLLLDITGRGLGMSAAAFRELPEIKYAKGGVFARLEEAFEYVRNHIVFPVELPAFDPSVCQTLTTDKNALETFEEFPEGGDQMLYAGGIGGTIWIRTRPFPVNILKKPFAVVGFLSDGRAVIKQSYHSFLRQFLPDPEE